MIRHLFAPSPSSRLLLCLIVACSALITTPFSARAENDPPFQLPPRAEVLKIRSAILETSKGKLFIELFPEEAPWHVANFKHLADSNFYAGLKFHFFAPERFIQGGDPTGTGFGGPDYSLPAEFSDRTHRYGTLGMARKRDGYNKKKELVNPERRSSASQFIILLQDAPHMDGRYTVFGKVVGGLDVLDQLRANDTIIKLTVFIRPHGR